MCQCGGSSNQLRVVRAQPKAPIVAKTILPIERQRQQQAIAERKIAVKRVSGVRSARDVNKYRDQ